jgi:hypothetical protein
VFGRQHVWVEAAMVADQDFNIVLSSYGDQIGCGLGVSADGLFAEDVYSCFSELGGQRDMGMVRGADDGGVWSIGAGEESSDGRVEGGGAEGRGLDGGGAGVYDCDERGGGVGVDVLAVSFSYQAAAADDGNF